MNKTDKDIAVLTGCVLLIVSVQMWNGQNIWGWVPLMCGIYVAAGFIKGWQQIKPPSPPRRKRRRY